MHRKGHKFIMKRKSIGTRHEMIVQPTFIIGTYNEDRTPDFAPITWVSKTCEKDYDYLIVISMYGTKKTKQNVYKSKKIRLPKPEMYVIYTGNRKERPEYISLAEEFFGNRIFFWMQR